MLWLCRMCRTEVDGPECEYCADVAVEVPYLWELKVQLRCPFCNSTVTSRIDHDHPDILDLGHFEYKYCPSCQTWGNHIRTLVKIGKKKSADEFLDQAYQEELRRDNGT